MGAGCGRCAADAAGLPFADGCFGVVLLADVLEHCPDDGAALAELARVLRPGGVLVVTVPSLEWGAADLLPRLGVPTVHDEEGPERHFREGYRCHDLRHGLAAAGLEVEVERSILRLGSKLLIEGIALAHLVLERLTRRRRHWTWSDVVSSPPAGLGLYRRLFPVVRALHALLARLPPRRGFELAIRARKRASAAAGAIGRRTGSG